MTQFVIPDEVARRENLWLRMAIMGPAGAGKTLGALTIASHLFGGGLPIVAGDSECDRMRLYADQFAFHHVPVLGDHSPERWIALIDAAEAKYAGGVLILDSFSHEWIGTGGVLQLADRFGQWKDVRPRHTAVIDRLMAVDMHVICCIRAKMKYEVIEEAVEGSSRTRQVINKLGIGPVQDDAIIYEFDVVADVDARSHDAMFSNRCAPLVGTVHHLDAEVARILTGWLSEGEPPAPPAAADPDQVAALRASLLAEGITDERITAGFDAAMLTNRGVLHPDYVAEQLAKSQARLAAKPGAAVPAAEPAAVPAAEPAAVQVPDGLPEDSWTVAQIDAWAAENQVAGYPSGGNKVVKLDACNRHLESTAPVDEEEIPFGEPTALPVGEA